MDDVTDLELQQPPTKRRRKSLGSIEMEADNKQFWFHDGDIVLEIEDKHLRVKIHREKLMDSLMFSTMLGLPTARVHGEF